MKRTTLEMFREELLRTGGYVSAPERMATSPRRPGALTTLGFSWSVFSVFPRCGVAENLGYLTTDIWAHYCFRCVQKAESNGTRVTVEGFGSRAAHKGPVVYLANHMSSLETVLLPAILLAYGPFSTVVKKSLSELPGLRKATAHMGLVPIGRTNPREDLMTIFDVCGARIARGDSVLIFAQGTRQSVFARAGWSSIGTKLAEKAGVPVVPIAVKTDVQPTRPGARGLFKDFGTVDPSKDIRVACGPVLEGRSRETVRSSFDWIRGRLDAWGLPTDG